MKINRIFLFSLLTALILIAVFLFLYKQKTDDLKVVFFDIGQGDSSLIQTPYGQDIVIDGGPDNAVLEKLGKNMGLFNNDIELMVLTHPHEDHLTGLIEILNRYKVDKVILTGVKYDSRVYEIFLDKIKKEGAEILIINKKQKIKMGDSLYLEILFPVNDLSQVDIKDINNTSIVIRMVYGENSFLFMGDAEEEIENKLVGENLVSQVLKVSHHGSKTNNIDFLNFVSPQYSVISVGKNNLFGHPSRLILNHLQKIDSKILRTDELGDVYFFSDQKKLRLVY